MPPRFSFNTDLTSSVNAPLLIFVLQKNRNFVAWSHTEHLMEMLSVYYFKGRLPFDTHVFSIVAVVLQVFCTICVCMLDYEYLCVLAWLMTGVDFFGGEFCHLV